MQHADEALLSVVVLELGSSWPTWLAEYQQHAPDSLVVAQSSDEPGAAFAQRVERKVQELTGRDVAIHAGLLVCNGALDEPSSAARRRMGSALLSVMLKKQRGELVLAGDNAAAPDVRQELFALAGTLCEGLQGASLKVSVRVRFDTVRPAPSASGVMKSAARAEPSELSNSAERALKRSR
jgi:hypothetical protein